MTNNEHADAEARITSRSADGSAARAPSPSQDEVRIAEAMDEYLKLLQDGERPDREAFLARYPQVAGALEACLQGLDFVHVAGAELSRPAAGGAGRLRAATEAAEALGDFRILREVGRGGMGVVYEAEQRSLGRRVALKVLPFAATVDPRQLQRFQNEARAAAGLHHTNIVPVYAVGCERGVHYYAMQFIEGHTLAEFIALQRGERDGLVPTATEAKGAAASTPPPAAQATSAVPRDAAY